MRLDAYDTALSPRVSVVMVNWNSGELLNKSLQSLDQLDDDVSFEVIVVDNGSGDGSAELLRREWPDVRTIALPDNLGFGAANNIGFTHVRGEHVLLLNPDTQVLPGMLATMVGALDADPSLGCVGAKHYNPDMSLQWSMDDAPTLTSEALEYLDAHRLPFLQNWLRRRYPRWCDHDEDRDVDWVNGACMLVPKHVVDQTKGFDTYFFLFAEELDWCLRIRQHGWRVRFLANAGVIHELGGTFAAGDGRRRVLLYQSSLRYFRKNKSFAEHIALHAITKGNAAVRLGLITGMTAWEKLRGRAIDRDVWEVVRQHPGPMSYRQSVRLWWSVLTLRTHADIRPVPPS